MSEGIYWLQPIVTDGVIRWPTCEALVTEFTGTRNRAMDDRDCALAAKIDYRGTLLCQRHASKLLLREFVKERPAVTRS